MRFFILVFFIIAYITTSSTAYSQSQQQDEFFNDLLISEEYSKIDNGDLASQDARSRLKAKKNKIDINDDIKLKEILKKQQKEKQKKAISRQDVKRISQLSPAPFGLLWGETYEETLSSGVILTKTEEKDYINSFIATQLPKPLSSMRYVVVSFGEDNQLWRIISYGQFIKDTANAEKGLKEYQRFYDLLSKKYGNAEQTFQPKITQKTKLIDLGKGKTKEEIENIKEPIGNPKFLSQLQSGEADLYASFYNNEVGAALSLNVDGNGNSYVIIEYKNIKLFQEQQDKTFDAL